MRSHDLKFKAISCGFITFKPVVRFGNKVTNSCGQMWILIKDKFKIQIKILNNRLKFFYALAWIPI